MTEIVSAPAEAAIALPDTQMPDDSANWSALEKEYGDEGGQSQDDAPTGENTVAGGEGDQAKAEPAKKEPLPYDELEKRHKDLQGALTEERGTRKQLAERIQNMEAVMRQMLEQQRQPPPQQQQQAQPPSLDDDPIGYFEHRLAEQQMIIESLQTGNQSFQRQTQEHFQEQQFWNGVERSEQQFRAATPDYDDAVKHLEDSRVAELKAIYADDSPGAIRMAQQNGFSSVAELRNAVLNQDRVSVAQQAFNLGMEPAQLYYNLAKQRGYAGKVPAQRAPNVIEMTRAGQQATQSLSQGGSGARDDMTPGDIADLYLRDPEAADKAFERMRSSGAFG